jgi:hypothetical protein
MAIYDVGSMGQGWICERVWWVMRKFRCTNCGQEWPADYCPACGHTIVAPAGTASSVDDEGRNRERDVVSMESRHGNAASTPDPSLKVFHESVPLENADRVRAACKRSTILGFWMFPGVQIIAGASGLTVYFLSDYWLAGIITGAIVLFLGMAAGVDAATKASQDATSVVRDAVSKTLLALVHQQPHFELGRASLVVEPYHVARLPPKICYYGVHSWEQPSGMPLDLGHHPSTSISTCRRIVYCR